MKVSSIKSNKDLLKAYVKANEALRRRRAIISSWPPHGESVFYDHIAEFIASEVTELEAARKALGLE